MFTDLQITPWIHFGIQISLFDGISINAGININDTWYDLNIGLGPVGIVVVAIVVGVVVVLASGGTAMEPVLNFWNWLFGGI